MAGHGVRAGDVRVSYDEGHLCPLDRLSERPRRPTTGPGDDTAGWGAHFHGDQNVGAVQHPGIDRVPATDGMLCSEWGFDACLHPRYGKGNSALLQIIPRVPLDAS